MQRNAPSKIDPELLGELNYEQQFTQSISNSKRQIKMEKGKSWRVRYLPAKLGPKKTFFARIAKHWLATKPIICPRQTSPAFGGDPDAFCPVCDRANELNDSANQAESQLGYDTRSSPQWLAYCVVFEKDGLEQPMSEVLVPYEHWMYKSTWEELKAFYMAGGQKSPLSVLDYKLGNDFILSRTSKGFKLDKQDSMPIFELTDPKYPEWIKKIEEHLKNPRVQLPTNEELDAFALKLEEQVNKLRGVSSGARRGRPSAGLEEDDMGQQQQQEEHVDEPESPRRAAPARPAAAAAPARAAAPATRRPAPQPDPEAETEQPAEEAPADDDQIPGAEVPAKPAAPARPAARPAAATAATARPAARPAAAATATRRPAAPPPEPEPEPEPEAEAQPDPEAESQPEPEQEPEPEPAPAPKASGRATARPAAPAARRPAPQPEPEAEDDNLPPDETADQAPPAPMEGEEEPAAAPPPVSRKGAALGSAIKDKINAVKNRGL